MKKQIVKILAIVVVFGAMVTMFPKYSYAIDFDVEEVYNSVVIVENGNSIGSGFAIGENCIITNAHVVDNEASRIKIQTYEGNSYDGILVLLDKGRDIAVIQIEDKTFPVLKVCNEKSISIGDDVYAIGAPSSMAYTLTKGILSAKDRDVDNYSFIQTDAPINPGNSGGPLVTDEGLVIGVNTMIIDKTQGIGLSIPISEVCDYLELNGIKLNDDGNVDGKISLEAYYDKHAQGDPSQAFMSEDDMQYRLRALEKNNARLTLFFTASIIIIVVLLIVIAALVSKKKKIEKINRSLRTDFDIDIME